MVKNLSIKKKIQIVMIVVFLGFGILWLFVNSFLNDAKYLGDLKSGIVFIKKDILELRRAEKDFMLRLDLKHLEKFEANMKNLGQNIQKVEELSNKYNIPMEDFIKIKNALKEYEVSFKEYVVQQKNIGLTPEDGLYGNLRKSVHKVEDSFKKIDDYKALSLLLQLRRHEKDFMLRLDSKYLDRFNKTIAELMHYNSSNNTLLEAYKRDFTALVKGNEILGLTPKEGLEGKMRGIVHNLEKFLDIFYENTLEFANSKISVLSTYVIFISIFFVVVVLLFLGIIFKNIISSLDSFKIGLNGFFRFLNKETKDPQFIMLDTNDELGQMAQEINSSISKTKETIEGDLEFLESVKRFAIELSNGNMMAALEASPKTESLIELKSILVKLQSDLEHNIARSIPVLLDILESYSKYDFTKRYPDAYGKVAVSVNKLGDDMSRLLVELLQVGRELEGSSNKLLKNTNELSRSSSSAAATLEETAAALEEITATVGSNTLNVSNMSTYSKDVSNEATNGQKLATSTANAMDEITSQVVLINEAIAVIDQIAFQTNILSLNAAVEAATAGEAGKGFAVVAGEVRNLASRSSEAAKEIKELVEKATFRANEGKEISSHMINGYGRLFESISKTTQMIDEITKASKEQEIGISQINDSISGLDRQTQLNASIANETKEIAIQTDKLAKEIVQEAMSKEFLGKIKQ
jgi:methyl-accepting chemotaxis protein